MLQLIQQIYDLLINMPVVMLVMMIVPLLIVARVLKIYPSKRMLMLFSLPVLLSLLIVLAPLIGWTVLGVDCLILLLALGDLLTIPSEKKYSASRKLLKTASLAKPQDVEVELTNHASLGNSIAIKDDLPQSFEATPDQADLQITGKSRTLFKYSYVSNERGQQIMECVHLKVTSRLGLWRGYFKVPCPSVINVYPDMKQISEFDLLAKTNRLSLLGMRRTRKIGQDNEFERLRDYTQDDNYKHIDWRTTARRRRLTVRDFQSNQSQRIIFLVDCGRMMTGTVEGLSLLDYSLNAMLMLSYVALKQGDSVGLISFSNTIHNYTPARSGVNHINRLLHASYNQRPSYVESRYDEAFLYLKTHCRKRSLVVLVTNVIDEINSHQIQRYLGSMTGRHLPLGVLLKDRGVFESVDNVRSQDSESLYQGAAAVNVLGWRNQVIKDLKHQGVLALDLFPEQLTAALVNQYLEIKARHLL